MAKYSLGGGTVTVNEKGEVISLDTVIWERTIWRKDTILIPTPPAEDLGEPIAEQAQPELL